MTPRLPTRGEAARRGTELARIIGERGYRAPSGRWIDLSVELARSIAGTVSYRPDTPRFERPPSASRQLEASTANEASLEAAYRLHREGRRPAVLNFASAKNPGGGFRSGARAQEESLCQASTLFACLEGQPMYEHHRALHHPLYTRWTIHSPEVPVVRGADGALLESPWPCTFLTSPAPNTKVLLERAPLRSPEVSSALTAGVRQILAVAANHGHDTLVLGAWGCGVFGNDPATVARLFRDALLGEFVGVFSRVHFAVLDWSEEQCFLGPFARTFG